MVIIAMNNDSSSGTVLVLRGTRLECLRNQTFSGSLKDRHLTIHIGIALFRNKIVKFEIRPIGRIPVPQGLSCSVKLAQLVKRLVN